MLGEGLEVLGVAVAQRRRFAALVEPRERVRADRLEHREAGLAVRLLVLPEQVVVDQRCDCRERHLAAADRLHGLESAAAGEHREPGEEAPVLWPEQVVAPVDRRPERLAAR